MTRPDGRCPHCGGHLTVTPATTNVLLHAGAHSPRTGRGLTEQERRCTIAACDACEFVRLLALGVAC